MEFLQQSLECLFLCAVVLARLSVQGFCIRWRWSRGWSAWLGPPPRLACLRHGLSREQVCEPRGLAGWGVEAGWRFDCFNLVSFGGRHGGQFGPGEGLEELVRTPFDSRSGLDRLRVRKERRRRGRRLYFSWSLSGLAPSSARLHCFHEFLQVSFGVAMGLLFGWLIQPLWFSL